MVAQKPPHLRYLIFYVTSRCNMRCSHCFYLDELNKRDEMSVEELEKVAESVRPLTFLRITGGEPFLRKDLPEVVSLFYHRSQTRRMGIITNGSRAEWVGKAIDQIYQHCPELQLDVGVSIDGLESTHDKIRRLKGAYQHARETTHTLVERAQRYSNLQTSLVVTVTSLNEPELDDLYEEIAQWGVDRLSVNHVRGKVHDPSLLEVSHEKYREFARRCEEYHLSTHKDWKSNLQRAKNRISGEAIEEVVSGQTSRLPCLAGSAIGVLYSDGEVYVCEMLEKPNSAINGTPESHPRLGNLRDVDHDFYRLWHSPNAHHCREWIWKTNCSCTHECFLTASVYFGKKNYPRLASEWLRQTFSLK